MGVNPNINITIQNKTDILLREQPLNTAGGGWWVVGGIFTKGWMFFSHPGGVGDSDPNF